MQTILYEVAYFARLILKIAVLLNLSNITRTNFGNSVVCQIILELARLPVSSFTWKEKFDVVPRNYKSLNSSISCSDIISFIRAFGQLRVAIAAYEAMRC